MTNHTPPTQIARNEQSIAPANGGNLKDEEST